MSVRLSTSANETNGRLESRKLASKAYSARRMRAAPTSEGRGRGRCLPASDAARRYRAAFKLSLKLAAYFGSIVTAADRAPSCRALAPRRALHTLNSTTTTRSCLRQRGCRPSHRLPYLLVFRRRFSGQSSIVSTRRLPLTCFP